LNGSRFVAEWSGSRDGLGADTEFDQLSVITGTTFTRNRNTFGATAKYFATISGTAPVQSLFTLGGFGNLAGNTAQEITGQHSAFAALLYYRRLNGSHALPFYAGMTLEAGNAWDNRSDISFSDTIGAGSLFLATTTPIGPIYLAYGRAEGSKEAVYFFLGRPF
jgi:NTE family protein